MTISESDSSTFVGFPMPNDAESLTDRARRPIVRSAQDGPRFPFRAERLVRRLRGSGASAG